MSWSKSSPLRRHAPVLVASALVAALLGGCSDTSAADESESQTTEVDEVDSPEVDSPEEDAAEEGDASEDDAAEEGADAAEQDGGATAEQGEAVMRVDSREFAFTLTLCTVGGEDILIEGAGQDEEGTPGWLSGDLVGDYGEFRIDVGTDQPFDSMDEIYVIGSALGDGLVHTETDGTHTIAGQGWGGSGLDVGPAEVVFTCH